MFDNVVEELLKDLSSISDNSLKLMIKSLSYNLEEYDKASKLLISSLFMQILLFERQRRLLK